MANEKRLIDANALFEEIERVYVDHYEKSAYKFIHDFFNAMRRRIRRAPTVDAEPVIHGYWVKHNFLGHEQYACSQCQTLGSPQWKRCPVCEAKMDGGNENV